MSSFEQAAGEGGDEEVAEFDEEVEREAKERMQEAVDAVRYQKGRMASLGLSIDDGSRCATGSSSSTSRGEAIQKAYAVLHRLREMDLPTLHAMANGVDGDEFMNMMQSRFESGKAKGKGWGKGKGKSKSGSWSSSGWW